MELTEDKEKLKMIYNSDNLPEQEKIEKVLSIYDQLNIRQETEAKMNELTAKAETHLNSISVSEENLAVIKQLQKSLLERIN